jgi:hypothetical protein
MSNRRIDSHFHLPLI